MGSSILEVYLIALLKRNILIQLVKKLVKAH